jgi:hypothetical protein
MLTDQRVKRELELLEAEAKVSPEIRRRIVNDHLGMWVGSKNSGGRSQSAVTAF